MDATSLYEKLGLLYLGREVDIAGGLPSPQPLLYQNKNMTTHGVIIGMTGSGKTGLGIALIEEAIMDNIPSIIIDPKGDMGNLLLTFPRCSAEDFIPWIDSAEAAKKELTVDQYAAKIAETWRSGLHSWGQGPERIAALRGKTDMTIYTPGSSAGVPVSVLSSFLAPAEEIVNDTDTLNSLINSTTTSLLTLVDITGDPLQSREHILLSSLLLHFWRVGRDLTMEALIGAVVNPPFDRIGVFPLDTFYPQSQRMALAMRLNNILAGPTFSAWTMGESLDIQRMLYTEEGTPRTAIFSIAHLSEAERMFFVTMLLNQFIGWMRRQQGASSLKALLYMDEIFGYFPPIANPPSKKPMMLLLNSVHLEEPLLFESRWVMSYLKGPMSNNDIKRLMAGKKIEPRNITTAPLAEAQRLASVNMSAEKIGAGLPPLLPQGIEQLYHLQNVVREEVRFAPWLAAEASVRFFNARRNIDVVQKISLRLCLDESFALPDWDGAAVGSYSLSECTLHAPGGSYYYPLPGWKKNKEMCRQKRQIRLFPLALRLSGLFSVENLFPPPISAERQPECAVSVGWPRKKAMSSVLSRMSKKYKMPCSSLPGGSKTRCVP